VSVKAYFKNVKDGCMLFQIKAPHRCAWQNKKEKKYIFIKKRIIEKIIQM